MKFSDLHCHLGAMSTARELWEISKSQGINVGLSYDEFVNVIYNRNTKTHDEYLKKFELTHKIQSSPAAIEKCVYDSVARSYVEDDVDLIEIRFNPMLRNNDGFYDLDSIILHACMGLQKAKLAFPVKAGIIISTDRSFAIGKSLKLVEKASMYQHMGVVGFDMSGAIDPTVSLSYYKPIFEKAKQLGLKTTIHAGEIPDNRSGLELYEILDSWYSIIDRIGHGVQSHKHPLLMNKIADRGIHLEICPTSNITTGCVDANMMVDVVETINDNGISFSINTDGVTFLKTSMAKEMNIFPEHLRIAANNNARSATFIK
jgi:adenosine deaminase